MLRFAAIGLDHRHIYHLVGELIARRRASAPAIARRPATRACWTGFRERFPDAAGRSSASACSTTRRSTSSCCAAIPRDRAGHRDPTPCAHGKDVMVDKPGVTTLDQISRRCEAVRRRDRPHLLDLLFRALRRARPARRRRGSSPRARSAASCRPPASGRTGSTARSGRPGSSSRARLRRHPDRHRLAPDRPVPVLHRRHRRARSSRSAVANHALPDVPGVRGLRRDPAAQRRAPRASSASTGSRPTACRPGATAGCSCSAPRATSSCASTSTSPAGRAPTTCSCPTARHAPHRRHRPSR